MSYVIRDCTRMDAMRRIAFPYSLNKALLLRELRLIFHRLEMHRVLPAGPRQKLYCRQEGVVFLWPDKINFPLSV